MDYELYYWPGFPGRGEFIRLALEAGDADYIDIGNASPEGAEAVVALLQGGQDGHPHFAPPLLKAGGLTLSHVANILFWLGPRLNLVPDDDESRQWANGLQLTVTDFTAEVHDLHHPLGPSLYYEEQKAEARRRADAFIDARLPRFLHYFEQALTHNAKNGDYLVGRRLSYVDLSLFHMVQGLRYALPNAMAASEASVPRVIALHDSVRELPLIDEYLTSERRLPFGETGIFRHYPALDMA